MATRPCVTSASRSILISATDLSLQRSSGSKLPAGSSAPGRPAQNLDGSAVQPLIVGNAGGAGSSGSSTAAARSAADAAPATGPTKAVADVASVATRSLEMAMLLLQIGAN